MYWNEIVPKIFQIELLLNEIVISGREANSWINDFLGFQKLKNDVLGLKRYLYSQKLQPLRKLN